MHMCGFRGHLRSVRHPGWWWHHHLQCMAFKVALSITISVTRSHAWGRLQAKSGSDANCLHSSPIRRRSLWPCLHAREVCEHRRQGRNMPSYCGRKGDYIWGTEILLLEGTEKALRPNSVEPCLFPGMASSCRQTSWAQPNPADMINNYYHPKSPPEHSEQPSLRTFLISIRSNEFHCDCYY